MRFSTIRMARLDLTSTDNVFRSIITEAREFLPPMFP